MKILPGSPFDEERFLRLEEAKQAEALARYGLDKPVPVQFARYIGNMLKGDFGISFYYTNIPVTQVIFSRLGPSVIIGTQAILIGLAIGLSLGIIAACRHNGIVDNFTMILAVLGISVPNFVAAALLQYYFGLKLGWLPIGFWKGWTCSVLPSVALCPHGNTGCSSAGLHRHCPVQGYVPGPAAAETYASEFHHSRHHHHGFHGRQPAHRFAGG